MFIDYILRPEVMAKIIENYPYKNVNIETEKYLDSNYLDNEAANIEIDVMENGFFVKNIGDNVKLYDKIWAQIK